MFDSRRGFCEHYAYSFVAMLRMVGIPARIIAGYQGGEVNPLNNTLIVRQFDAHAWAEVWFGDGGWTRIDPTAAVAPSRIELGMEAALDGQPGFLSDSVLSAYRFRGIKILNWMRNCIPTPPSRLLANGTISSVRPTGKKERLFFSGVRRW